MTQYSTVKIVSYLPIVENSIKIIQDWFLKNYGIKINKSQAVCYTIASLPEFDLNLFKTIKEGYRAFRKGRCNANIPLWLYNKYEGFNRKYGAQFTIKDKALMLSALIKYRQVTLPDMQQYRSLMLRGRSDNANLTIPR